MRTPFGWTLPSQTSLQVACACYALWGGPTAALAAPEQSRPAPVASTPAPAAPTTVADDSTARIGGASFNRRVLMLVAVGCLVGIIVGRARRDRPRETRFRLYNKPQKVRVSVLVPPTPAPRLIPSESPNATRARSIGAPVSRPTPVGAAGLGVIHYIAAFADSAEASGGTRIDYLLVSSDGEEESADPPGGLDVPPGGAG
jgi:hypothetical protein